MYEVVHPPQRELPPAKRAYRLNELIDGAYYRCRLSGKVVLYKDCNTIYFWNEKEQGYTSTNRIHNFQLEDL